MLPLALAGVITPTDVLRLLAGPLVGVCNNGAGKRGLEGQDGAAPASQAAAVADPKKTKLDE
jgi:hypothetical protein